MGTRMVAFDSHIKHDAEFNEGLSLQVMCKDQAELDAIWTALQAGGGREVNCGWLNDRFGFRGQVVPAAMADLLTGDDEAAKERAFKAMLTMKKLDIATLEGAAQGRS